MFVLKQSLRVLTYKIYYMHLVGLQYNLKIVLMQ